MWYRGNLCSGCRIDGAGLQIACQETETITNHTSVKEDIYDCKGFYRAD